MRYNKKGIHSGLLDEIFNRSSFPVKINLPKPNSQGEIMMLSKFIFGEELKVLFDYKHCKLEMELRNQNPKVVRKIKLIKLKIDNGEYDKYIYTNSDNYGNNKKLKMELLGLSYSCDKKHDSYYDSKFSMKKFRSSYVLDHYFWSHCIGELSCGGISARSYGQVRIYDVNEYLRLKNFSENDLSVREEFKKEIDDLILRNNKYDNIKRRPITKK
jgi:hypothetical protein